jgi:hypothetical protein
MSVRWTEELYHELCAACDAVLQAPDATVETVAIPWLHVVREHPVFLRQYEHFFAQAPTPAVRVPSIWDRTLHFASWHRSWLTAVLGRGTWWYGELPDAADVLFLSHLVDRRHAGSRADFYFGDMPERLREHGLSAVIALIDHTGGGGAEAAERWQGGAVPRVILSGALPVSEERAIRRRLTAEARRLRGRAEIGGAGVPRGLWREASRQARSGGAVASLRIGEQVGRLVARLQPRALVTTFEGHAWERTAFAAARGASSGLRCLAYQHAAVFRLQHAIRRGIARDHDPDEILASGPSAAAQLASSCGNMPIRILGSTRHGSGRPAGAQPENACLILPEGLRSECRLMIHFALEAARMVPEFEFVLRLHPLIARQSLERGDRLLRDLPPNVRWSEVSLSDEAARCRWTLYRGTTAVVEAVRAGSRPIYLEQPGEIPVDPLYQIAEARPKVSSADGLARLLRKAGAEQGDVSVGAYCDGYFAPPAPGVLAEAVDSIGGHTPSVHFRRAAAVPWRPANHGH